MRELLCGTQSSKERLRRSRTESSAAPPAIEELAGEARQVRPARAACGSVSTDFGLLTGGEVRRAPGPPAPATNLSPQRPNMPPLSCSRTTEAGSFPPRHKLLSTMRRTGRRLQSTVWVAIVIQNFFCRRNCSAKELISMRIKWYHWIIPISLVFIITASVCIWLIFEDNRRLLCRFALGAVACSLELYQDKFGELPPSLEILSKEFPEYRKFVYLGYKPRPWSWQRNNASLLYNRTPATDFAYSSQHSGDKNHIREWNMEDVLLAAPIPILGKRIVIFHRDFANQKRMAKRYPISESDFSDYWTADKQKQRLIPRRR